MAAPRAGLIPEGPMKRFSSVAIVGMGLIGGSIGLGLRKFALAEKIIGIGRRQATLRIARRVGAVTNTTIGIPEFRGHEPIMVV